MCTADRMKRRRLELGLGAEEIAKAIGVSRSTYFRYESGDIEKMPITILEPLAIILRTTPQYLVGWEDKNDSMDSSSLRVAAHIDDDVSAEDMEDIIKYIEFIKSKHSK